MLWPLPWWNPDGFSDTDSDLLEYVCVEKEKDRPHWESEVCLSEVLQERTGEAAVHGSVFRDLL
jgi:hypothetical protein